ncbi:MAG: DUF3108 domain-containing protein [Dysgonomonas sp.]|jgi:hypothetical protein|uniref:DUF3108 domain-containing protein n=1 Tax=unclassified Dysgonomonas TaxID=2630389 RepID=UPI0025B954C4|nr:MULTISPECIES: DUF3108 domain-containing protein [unclassified Dysgonomonas]MDR1716578.1 DUF3108 domain-containing protein [Prevotella sp.]MDR2001962.1 DUF3108 domain-containing protein [Prevotella sp.]HMM02447.1 DUF3108 domain-containing protein [Dysgonomonas sp.]
MIKRITGIALMLLVLVSMHTQAQGKCKINNIYFQAGEEMTYDLYFKYGLIHTKAGISTLKTVAERYNNTDALKMTLMAQSTGTARKIFSLNDTLSCYLTKDLVPLAYVKNAAEGKDYTKERVTYTYTGDKVSINTIRHKNGDFKFNETLTSHSCMYDMMSVVYYARTLNYSGMKKGETVKVDFISGKKKVNMVIEYEGIEIVEANDDNKYSCMKLTLSIMDDAFSDKKEAMKVYITNDNNRMPVRLDSKLNIGSTRAMLKSYKGNRYPVQTK